MEKQKVIETLAGTATPNEQFNVLLQQMISHPHAPGGVVRFLNAGGYTPSNLDMLKYDIKKLYGISDNEVGAFVPKATSQAAKDNGYTESGLRDVLNKDVESLNYHKELKALAIEVSNSLGHELPNTKKATLVAYLNEQKAKLMEVSAEVVTPEVTNVYAEAPEEAKDGLKLRQEFPFLSDADCPDKLKILVADKFTALENYEAAHAQIQKMRAAGKTEGLFELGKQAVENWELNQLIYDELNHYQDKKEILGNHPIFADEMMQKLVDAYSTQEAMKRQGNLRTYISRDTKNLEKAKDAKKKATIEAKLAQWQEELNLIDARLNAANKK